MVYKHQHPIFNDIFSWFDSQDLFPNRLDQFDSNYPPNESYLTHKDELVLRYALAGWNKENISISYDKNRRLVTVSGKSMGETQNIKAPISKQSIARRSFEHRFTLPDDYGTSEENIIAEFENGLLTLTIPKQSEAEKKYIAISEPFNEDSSQLLTETPEK